MLSYELRKLSVLIGVCPHTLSLSLPSPYVMWVREALLPCIATLVAPDYVQLLTGTTTQKEDEERNLGCFSQLLSLLLSQCYLSRKIISC